MLNIQGYARKSIASLLCVLAVSLACHSDALAKAEAPASLWGNIPAHSLNQALKDVARNQRTKAFTLASRTGNRQLYELVKWVYFIEQPDGANFKELQEFIRLHPDWPSQDKLRRSIEERIDSSVSPRETIGWLERFPPLSGKGMWKLASSYQQSLPFMPAETQQELKKRIEYWVEKAWVDGNFDLREESAFYDEFASLISEGMMIRRVDRLLWNERTTQAKRWMKSVPKSYQYLFDARIRLIKDDSHLEQAINRVPRELARDPGLLVARMKWRHKRKLQDGVIELLKQVPQGSEFSSYWWKMSEYYARELIGDKKYREAYQLLRFHNQTDKSNIADAEWLMGWVALRFLNDPDAAAKHFQTMVSSVSYPISLSRGAYWLGRSYERLNQHELAKQWYQYAMQFPYTYYGQLAAYQLDATGYLRLPKDKIQLSAADHSALRSNELLYMAALLLEADKNNYAKLFVEQALDHEKEQNKKQHIITFLANSSRADIAIHAAFQEIKEQRFLLSGYFPVPAFIAVPEDKDAALTLAIIRQESRFFPEAKSSAGAMGMMQLLPSTAEHVAKSIGWRYHKAKLLSDPNYNIGLGASYIAQQEASFGSRILAIAAYNAGGGNVKKWVNKNGDPRTYHSHYEVIDWIEHIPFAETRNYVQRVMEASHVYDAMLRGGGKHTDHYLIEARKPIDGLFPKTMQSQSHLSSVSFARN